MNDDADGAPKGAPVPASTFLLRTVPKATAAERLAREEGMTRALRNGATPYRDRDGKWRHIPFKDANLAAVEPWLRDPRAKRGYRRVQELRKAAGQLVGQPGDLIEIAKRLGQLHWEQGSDVEGAARRGLFVSDYGARVADVYASRAWERNPAPQIYSEMDRPVDWQPEVMGYGRRREELKKRLAERTPESVLDDPHWGNASP